MHTVCVILRLHASLVFRTTALEAGRDLSSSQKLCGLAAITSVHVYLPITKISHSKVPDLTAGHGLSTY